MRLNYGIMRILQTVSGLAKVEKGSVLSIGNFDGVHIGHQRIAASVCRIAKERGAAAIAMTFEPHPVAILHPEKTPGVLTPLALKRHLLSQEGLDCLIILRDSAELLNLSPSAFVKKFLMTNIKPAVVVEGEDFNFGSARQGTVDSLKQFGSKNGFEVVVCPAQKIELSTGQSVRVSSTMIRYMLESGHVADAAAALSRPYRVAGEIIAGRGIGKQHGYPTLNMKSPAQIIPSEGVYAGRVATAESCQQVCTVAAELPAVFSIGQARTYGQDFGLLIEAHILLEGFKRPNGKWMVMDFVSRIRSQHKFRTEEKLVEQIAKDCRKAKEILAD